VIVLDASAAVEYVLDSAAGAEVGRYLDGGTPVHFPELMMVEAVSALRTLTRAGMLSADRGTEAVLDVLDLDGNRHRHELLLPRAFELRHRFTTYDAVYIALAEALAAPLVTGDRRLARGAADLVGVELVS
jgi:predicted nucleic acid-binding protein